MNAEGALIVALQQELDSQSRALAEWRKFGQPSLPSVKTTKREASDFDQEVIRFSLDYLVGRTPQRWYLDFIAQSGQLSIYMSSCLPQFIAKLTVATSNNIFRLSLFARKDDEQPMWAITAVPGVFMIDQGYDADRQVVLNYPREHHLGIEETFMTFLREIHRHQCNFEIVIQE